MIGIFIIPTGVGAEIGGHAGDANPASKLVASICDELIVHPNVVNASDINEMTENMLYVEGSMLDRMLIGEIELKRVTGNKILVAVNKPVNKTVINAVSASRVTLGADIEIIELDTELEMYGRIEGFQATGDVVGWKELVTQLKDYKFNALAINTVVEVERANQINYFKKGGINPWGGVEAICSKLISKAIGKPVAHAPAENVTPDDKELFFIYDNEIVDPRIAPEAISGTYLHSVLKGLHKAPQIGKGISVDDIGVLVTPIDCIGIPHKECVKRGIPVIAVLENRTCAKAGRMKEFIFAENYLEVVGLISCIKTGITCESVRRPISYTKINNEGINV